MRLAALLIAALAGLRCLVSFTSMTWFDVDPRVDPSQFAGIGIDISLAIDAITLIASALVFAQQASSQGNGSKNASRMTLLAMPAVAILMIRWGGEDIEHLWRGGNGLSAIIGGIALLAACRADRSGMVRNCALAILVGAAGMVVARGAAQLVYEHRETVEFFRANRAEVLAANGWEPSSPQAAMFERRILQAEASGWFGLSNIYSSVAGAIGLLCLMISGRWSIGKWSVSAPLLVGCALALGTTFINGSKGALSALLLALGFCLWMRLRKGVTPRRAGWLAISIALVPFVAVLARWGIEQMATDQFGEHSLLFRSHYAQAALEMLKQHPAVGVGPEGFQSEYLVLRPLASPEEVNSAHNYLLDWLAAYGVAGLGLVAILMRMAWLAGTAAICSEDETGDMSGRRLSRGVVAVALVFMGALSITWESAALCIPELVLRVVGCVLGVSLGLAVLEACIRCRSLVDLGCSGACLVVVVHSGLDMVLFQHGSSAWAMALLAVAASGSPALPELRRAKQWVMPTIAAGVSVALGVQLVVVAVVSTKQEAQLAAAANGLIASLDSEDGVSTESLSDAASQLGLASVSPPRARLSVKAAEYHNMAARELVEGASPGIPREAQLAQAVIQHQAAFALADRHASNGHLRAGARVSRAAAMRGLAALGFVSWGEAATAFESAVEVDPRNANLWLRLSESLDHAGDREGARQAILRAVQVDDSYALDPLRQMSATERARVERRLTAPPALRP